VTQVGVGVFNSEVPPKAHPRTVEMTYCALRKGSQL